MTKQTILLIATLVCALSQGCNYVTIGGGRGGEIEASSLNMEAGHVTKDKPILGRNQLFGFGLTLSTDGKSGDSDAVDASEYSDLFRWESRIGTLTEGDTYQDGPGVGCYGKYGLEIIENSNLFITGFIGFTAVSESTEYTSSIPVYLYRYRTTKTDTPILMGYGLTWFLGKNKEWALQADFDKRRGCTYSIGCTKPF